MSATAPQHGQLAPWLILAFLLHAGLAWWLSDEELRRSAVVDARPAVVVRLLSAPEPAVAPEPTPPPPAPPVVERRPPPRPAPEPAPPEPVVETPPPVEAVVESEPVPEPESSLPAVAAAAPVAEVELPPAPASGPPTPTEDELERYKALVLSRIDAHKRYPLLARRRGIEGTVTIHIAIADTGAIALYEQVGDAPRLLAKTTRQAVEKAGPFPEPPGGALELRIPVDYRLE